MDQGGCLERPVLQNRRPRTECKWVDDDPPNMARSSRKGGLRKCVYCSQIGASSLRATATIAHSNPSHNEQCVLSYCLYPQGRNLFRKRIIFASSHLFIQFAFLNVPLRLPNQCHNLSMSRQSQKKHLKVRHSLIFPRFSAFLFLQVSPFTLLLLLSLP